jgi:DNA-binding transcriptional regulator YhcF (GntR family)
MSSGFISPMPPEAAYRPMRAGMMMLATQATRADQDGARMVHGDVSFDTRFERLTDHYSDAIARGELEPGERFPSARELSERHHVDRATAGRVHGTLISLGLIEHRVGLGTFVLPQPAGAGNQRPGLRAAAQKVVRAFDQWRSSAKPRALAEAISELRDALR